MWRAPRRRHLYLSEQNPNRLTRLVPDRGLTGAARFRHAAPRRPRAPRLLRDRRFLMLLALGFSAGAPLPLAAGQVLRQWFAESGISLAAIGLTALIGLAYANKFLWSPVLDHAVPPPFRGLGRRRGWLAADPAGCWPGHPRASASTDPRARRTVTVALAVLVAFLSASQDIVVDA